MYAQSDENFDNLYCRLRYELAYTKAGP